MKILITGGPTREPIDAVRYISNRSSGKMSLALAWAAAQAGHDTTLLLGPVGRLDLPWGQRAVRVVRFESSAQLQELLELHWPDHRVLIMAAAVADFRPRHVAAAKLQRGQGPLSLDLEPTVDLVAAMARAKRPDQRVIAFALEQAEALEARALDKLRRKKVDAIVANALVSMGDDSITPLWLTAAGDRTPLSKMTKMDFARWLIQKLEAEG